MDRTAYLNIAGKEYPMRFSLGASIAISKRYGSMTKMTEELDGKDETKTFEELTWITELLIKQGCAYKNLFEKDVPLPNNAPAEDGKYIPITAEAIQIGLSIMDMGVLKEKIFATISGGKKTEVNTEEKNAVAT